MSGRLLIKLGIGSCIVALLLPGINGATDLLAAGQVERWRMLLAQIGGGAVALGLVIYLVRRSGLVASRCAECRRKVPNGHAYCLDHLKSKQDKGREALHQQRGSGY